MARWIFGEKAVDLFQDFQRRRLALFALGFVLMLVVPDEILETLVARRSRVGVKFLQPLAEIVAEQGIGPAIAGASAALW